MATDRTERLLPKQWVSGNGKVPGHLKQCSKADNPHKIAGGKEQRGKAGAAEPVVLPVFLTTRGRYLFVSSCLWVWGINPTTWSRFRSIYIYIYMDCIAVIQISFLAPMSSPVAWLLSPRAILAEVIPSSRTYLLIGKIEDCLAPPKRGGKSPSRLRR